MKLVKTALAASILSLATAAHADIKYLGEVDSNAYITVGAYDVAWVAPCAQGITGSSCGAPDYSNQSQYGWAAMTSDIFNQLNIQASDFITDDGNYAYGNDRLAVAVEWFSPYHDHIDYSDGNGGYWSFADVNGGDAYDSLAFRVSSVSAVPEPSTYALMLGGLGLVGFMAARRRIA